jgi:hypothetical protein
MEMVSDVWNSLPLASVESDVLIDTAVHLHTQRSEPCVLIGPANGGSNSLRIVGYQLLYSRGESRVTVLSTQWP